MTTQYVMRAFKTTGPTGHVYWAVLGAPDNTGAQSGYNPADLSNITVDYTVNVPINGSGGISQTGLAGGDLSGTFPNPTVTHIQGTPVSATSPSAGFALVASGGIWTPEGVVLSFPLFFADLATYTATQSRQIAIIDGFSAPGDGGGGLFVWDSTSTATPDGGTIVAVTGISTGRWNRVYNGPISAKWFGAKGDGQRVTDANITATHNIITSVSATFTTTDVGKLCGFYEAGVSNATIYGTITGFTDAHTVTISTTATTTVNNGTFRWGTDDYNAIISVLTTIKTLSTTTLFTQSSTIYFDPGEYMISQTIIHDFTYNGINWEGASQGKAGPEPPMVSKITLMVGGIPLIKNTSQSNVWRNLWFDGGRLATRVFDFEYFGDHQSFYDCTFDAPSSQGYIHYYGQDNGALEIDNIKFWNCFLFSDLFDVSWVIQAYVWNNNGNAFQIDYYHGFWEGTVVYGIYLNQGSINLHGTQVYGWIDDFLHIYGQCSYMELEDVYTEQTSGNFINVVDNLTGITTDDTLVLRRCHLNAPVNINWIHLQPLKLEDTETGGFIFSNPVANLINGIVAKPIICNNLRFNYPGLDFQFISGVPHQLVHGTYYNKNNGTGTLCTDGTINSGTNILTSASNNFKPQNVGFPVNVPDALGIGSPLITYINKFDSSGQVELIASATNSVTGKTVTFQGTPFASTYSPQAICVVGNSGYDVDNHQLAIGSYLVPSGVPIIAADFHNIVGLTADRTYQLSNSGIPSPGVEMVVSRLNSSDGYKANIVFNLSTPTTIGVLSNTFVRFKFLPNSGWVLVEAGSHYSQGFTPPIQTGTLTLSPGTYTINTGITITANSQIHFTVLITSGSAGTPTTSTKWYQALRENMVIGGPGIGSFAVAAILADGTVNTSDASTLGYMIIN